MTASSSEHDAEIKTLYQSGLSMAAVAKRLGLSVNFARYRIEIMALPRRTIRETKLGGVDTAQVVRLYEQGLNQAQIAQHLGTTRARVGFRLREARIPLRTMSEIRSGQARPGRLRRVDWTCPQCGTTIQVVRNEAKTRKFCSRLCASRATPNPIFLPRTKQQNTCITCGAAFLVTAHKSKQQYCCIACARYDVHQRRRAVRQSPLERIVEALLVGMAVDYRSQWRLGRSGFSADFYISAANLAVECDGDYWHALPSRVHESARKERAFTDAGIAVLRLTESEINGNIRACKERILALLNSPR